MKLNLLVLGLVAVVSCAIPAKAELLNFDFTLASEPGGSGINGTIKGEIFGLENNATSTPSDIVLTFIPNGFGFSVPPNYSLKNNGWNLMGDTQGASFTVNSGTVSSATDFEAFLSSQDAFLSFNTPLGAGQTLNGFQFGSSYLLNTNGFAGVTFSPIATPEPSSWMLAALGLLSILWAAVRKSRTVGA